VLSRETDPTFGRGRRNAAQVVDSSRDFDCVEREAPHAVARRRRSSGRLRVSERATVDKREYQQRPTKRIHETLECESKREGQVAPRRLKYAADRPSDFWDAKIAGVARSGRGVLE
jgi:hypothetical protein